MRFWLGFATGIGAAWTALALWRKIPALPDFELEVMDRYQ